MSQLSDIQDAIRNRFKRVPLETGMGSPTYLENGQVQNDDVRQGSYQPNVFAQPQQSPKAQTVQQPRAHALGLPPADTETAAPTERSVDYGPPPKAPSAVSGMDQPPPPMNWNPIRTKSSGEPEVSPTAQGNRLDILEKEREALDQWKPKGHRGVRQVLKEGLEGAAASADPNNPLGMIGGFAVGAGSGGVQPNVFNKNFQTRKVEGQIKTALGEQAAKAQIAAAQYRPYYQQQQLGMAQGRLDQQTQNNHRRQLISTHNAAGEFDPDDPKNAGFVQEWTKEFGYPPTKKVSGSSLQYRSGYDENGNLVAEVVDKTTGKTTGVGGSQIAQTEQGAGREQQQQQFTDRQKQQQAQFEAREKRIKEVSALSRSAAMDRAKVLAGATASRLGDPDELGTMADKLDDEAAAAEGTGTKSGRAEAAKLKDMSTRLREQASKARRGQQGAGQPQSAAPTQTPSRAGRTITQANFDKYKADHGDAAAQQLLDSGVKIRQ